MSEAVVVGVSPGQPDSVVEQAASFAAHFDAELVCAHSDIGSYRIEEGPDGEVRSLPIDPDLPLLSDTEFPAELKSRLSAILGSQSVESGSEGSGSVGSRSLRWSTRALAGDPASALGHLAETLDAAMIVVGTRRASVRGSVREFLNGSVAAHLAHRQHRPVVVIPLTPVAPDDALPWESAR